jgi:hypothetical protein
MACAIQAFFLFSQSIRYHGSLGAWADIEPNIRTARQQDQTGTVDVAISYAMQIAQQNNKTLVVRRLRSVLGKMTSFAPEVTDPVGIDASTDAIFGFLVKQVEEWRLNKLSADSQNFLVQAHLKFARLRGKIPTGDIVEWGDVGNNFRKVFEAELQLRLAPIYRDPAYAKFRASRDTSQQVKKWGRPSLVHFLGLLEDYPNLEQDLRPRIDTKVNVLRDMAVIATLKNVDATFMSEGSHANPFPLEKAEQLTALLYRDGVMRRFLDILV